MKSSDFLFFLPTFYLTMSFKKSPKNFGKIAILKTWQMVSFWGVKTQFSKWGLKWCLFRHEKKYFNQYYVIAFDPRFRHSKHLKLTVWTSVLWKIFMQLAKKWPEMVIKWPFMNNKFSVFFFQNHEMKKIVFYAVTFDPIRT